MPVGLRSACLLPVALAVLSERTAPSRGVSDLVPQPVKQWSSRRRDLPLTDQTVLVARPGAEREAAATGVLPARSHGIGVADSEPIRKPVPSPLLKGEGRGEGSRIGSKSDAEANCIVLELEPSCEPQLGAEGYQLSVTPDRVVIRAGSEAGLFYGGVTLRQLLPVEVFGASRPGRQCRVGPCRVSRSQMRRDSCWRGLLLDVARHYMPVDFVKKYIDLAALHKFNMLQLHLTDDQGWRLEIKRYPRLTEIGSVRAESPMKGDRNRGDGTPYGPFFYTQEQIRELVAYAQARHVTLVPEIEMPGHFLAALAAYPQLSCTGGPFKVRTQWGIEPDVLCPGNDEAIEFAMNVLAEVTDMFPSPFIHIGGDEAPRDRWKACPKCQARMRSEGLQTRSPAADVPEPPCRTIPGQPRPAADRLGRDPRRRSDSGRCRHVVARHGRGYRCGRGGHDVVMSPTSHCYLDYAQARGPEEPEAIGGFLPLETVYGFEPLPAALPEAQQPHILGVQGNLWTEYISHREMPSISPIRGPSRWPKSPGPRPVPATLLISSAACRPTSSVWTNWMSTTASLTRRRVEDAV